MIHISGTRLNPVGRPAQTNVRRASLVLCCLLLTACAGREGGAYPEFGQFDGREVSDVRFEGTLQIDADSLPQVVVTSASSCQLLFLPFCLPGTDIGLNRSTLDLAEMARDVARLQLHYRNQGYYGTRVTPMVDPAVEPDEVLVRFHIRPGSRVLLRELELDGLDGILDPATLATRIPLRLGEPFRRSEFLAAADTIQAAFLREGRAFARVLRNFTVDTVANVAEVRYEAAPGPLVRVDTVLFEGGRRLGERPARDQLTIREGDILRSSELNRSQRNLYDLGFVGFASVEVAPDSLQRDPDLAAASVLVRIVETPQYQVDASAGYGSLDCFRTTGRWSDRNFLGEARRLDVTGSLSKIGVGAPLAAGLENNVCSPLRDDRFGGELDYRLAADLTQPRVFTAGTRGLVGLHTERISEVNAFLRESTGGQVGLSSRVGASDVVTATMDVERGRTIADPLIFCFGFEICTPEARAPLQRTRWSNAFTLTGVRDRVVRDRGAGLERGYLARASASWASSLLGSDDRYVRLLGDASVYREVLPNWILAGHLRGGAFLDGVLAPDGDFVPPERRFYAGGPNSVRGFGRNALGPRAFVEFRQITEDGDTVRTARQSAIGGTQTLEGSVELRFPAPIFGEFLRLGAFLDAGQVWAAGAEPGRAPLRATPGVGLRLGTPIGPVRLDAAYNPYPLVPGPRYVAEGENGELVLDDPDFQPIDDRDFLQRIQLHFTVGHAF